MAQSRPSSFVPDSFVPDTPSSFVPESFVPDDEPEKQGLGSWLYEKAMTPLLPEMEAPPEETYIGADTPIIRDIWPGGIRLPRKEDAYNEILRPMSAPVGLLMMGLEGLINRYGGPRVGQLPPDEPPPPPPPAPLRLGPAPTTPRFIAGEHGIVENVPHARGTQILSPEVLGEYGPHVGLGKPTTNLPASVLNTTELAEQNRLKNLDYTVAEQIPGGSLRLPPVEEPIPPVSGDTRLGFNPQSEGPLPYPLNVVPNAVRPRTVQADMARETQMGILDRLYDPEAIGAQGEVPTQGITPEVVPEVPPTLRPITAPPKPVTPFGLLDEFIKSGRGSVDADRMAKFMIDLGKHVAEKDWYKLAATELKRGNADKAFDIINKNIYAESLAPEVKAAAQTNPIVKSVVKTAIDASKDVPNLTQAATDPEFIKKYVEPITPTTRNTVGSRVAAGLGSAVETEIIKQSPYLGEMVQTVQSDKAIRSSTAIQRFNRIVEGLSETQEQLLVKAREGRVKLDPVKDARVAKALRELEVLDAEVSEPAVQAKIGLKSSDGTKIVPWQPRENHWPHMYTNEFFEAMEKNPTDFRARMIEQGMSPLEIDAVLARSKRFGERLIDAQHAREANLPGYRTDMNVYREHLTDLIGRTVEAEKYGPMDLADVNSPLMQAIGETPNPKYTERLMRKLLNRDVSGDYDYQVAARKVIGIQAWLHLGTAGISNFGSFFAPMLQADTRSFAVAIRNMIIKRQETGEFAEASGALQSVLKQVFAQAAEGHKLSVTKITGMDFGEKIMRTIGAETGRVYAKRLFAELKDNPNNQVAARELQRIILEDPKNVMKQPALSALQEKRAAFRIAALSQGLAEGQNLPYKWTGSGIADILTLFHKYQFSQTRSMKDAIKRNPATAIPMLIATYQMAGMITGGVKDTLYGTIKAAWSQDPNKIPEEFSRRRKFYEDKYGMSPELAFLAANAAQSFMLGVFGDLLEASGGTGSQALMNLLGSTGGDIAKMWDITRNLGVGSLHAIQGEEAPELQRALTGATSMIPIIGPPIAQEMRLNQP